MFQALRSHQGFEDTHSPIGDTDNSKSTAVSTVILVCTEGSEMTEGASGRLPAVGGSSLKEMTFWCLIRRKLTLCGPVNCFQRPQRLLSWRGNKYS